MPRDIITSALFLQPDLLSSQTYICHCSLTCIIPHQSWSWPCSANTCNIDNTATAAFLKLGHNSANGEEDALDVDVHDTIEFRLCDFQCRLIAIRGAGVVDQDVEAAELRDSCLNHLGPVCGNSDVCYYD